MRRIHHHIVCQHQIEVSIWPASAEVYYRDEPGVDPLNTQVRFDATVFNAPSGRVQWSVHDLSGGAGVGSIDQSGLYTAPALGAAPHVRTVVIVATSVDDPLRSAAAFVTLVDSIPIAPPPPTIDIYPSHTVLYYDNTADKNAYIDASNKRTVFEAVVRHAPGASITWSLNGPGSIASLPGAPERGLYHSPTSGNAPTTVTVLATVATPHLVAHADILLLSYKWPYPA